MEVQKICVFYDSKVKSLEGFLGLKKVVLVSCTHGGLRFPLREGLDKCRTIDIINLWLMRKCLVKCKKFPLS